MERGRRGRGREKGGAEGMRSQVLAAPLDPNHTPWLQNYRQILGLYLVGVLANLLGAYFSVVNDVVLWAPVSFDWGLLTPALSVFLSLEVPGMYDCPSGPESMAKGGTRGILQALCSQQLSILSGGTLTWSRSPCWLIIFVKHIVLLYICKVYKLISI